MDIKAILNAPRENEIISKDEHQSNTHSLTIGAVDFFAFRDDDDEEDEDGAGAAEAADDEDGTSEDFTSSSSMKSVKHVEGFA